MKFVKNILMGNLGADAPRKLVYRIILLNTMSIAGILNMFVFGTLALAGHDYLLFGADILTGLALLFSIVYFRLSGKGDLACEIAIGSAGLLFLFLFVTGAMNQTGHVWMFIFPLSSCFLLGYRKGLAGSLALIILSVVLVLALRKFSPLVAVYRIEFLARFTLSFIVVTVFSVSYEYVTDKAHNELSLRHKELASTFAELRGKESALKESEEKYRYLVERANDGIVLIQDAVIKYANPKISEVTGLDAKELVGKPFGKFFDPSLRTMLEERYKQRLQGEEVPSRYEFDMKLSRGQTIYVELNAGVTTFRGHPADLVFLRDITERKNYELQLKRATLTAEAASRAKSQFLANMSHEIRTPMNGVLGITELLLASELSDEQRRLAKMVLNSGETLLRVLNDILDFSKIEAGSLEFDRVEFNIRETVEEAVALFAEQASRKGIALMSNVKGEVGAIYEGDPARLRQILTNLLGNGLKFTEKGEVIVEADIVENSGDTSIVGFEVRDTGVGISPEAKGHIFNAFSQADGSMSRKYGGTGLGLAICKQLCEMMGGRIEVDSSPGGGSSFRFQVRLKNCRSPQGLEIHTTDLEGVRVLIADGNENNRRILGEQTSSWGMPACDAPDGVCALEKLRQASSRGEPFNVAILDMDLEGIDGVTLAGRIKADSSLSGVKLIMLAPFGRKVSEQARRAGTQMWLSKPTGQSQLYNALLSVCAKKVTLPVLSRGPAEKAHLEGTVLVAEDNLVNQKFARAILECFGLSVDVASNGRQVLEALGRKPYDLILMDCQMPEMDGYEAALRIRQNEAAAGGSHIPIIAVTAHAMEGDRELCFSAGMDDYLSKPFKGKQLAEVLERRLGRARGAPIKGRAAENGPQGTGGRTEGEQGGSGPAAYIDVGAALERMEGDEPLFLSLLSDFLEMWESEFSGIRAALEKKEFAEACLRAHSIKGAAGSLSAKELAKSAAELESTLRSGAATGLGDLVARLEQVGGDTMAYARQLLISREPPGAPGSESPRSAPASDGPGAEIGCAPQIPVFTNPDQALKHLGQITQHIKAHDPVATREALGLLAAVFAENSGDHHLQRLSDSLSEYDFDAAMIVVEELIQDSNLLPTS